MQKEVSKPAVIGVIAAAIVLLGGVYFLALRDKPPTRGGKKIGQVGPPPGKPGPPPAWVLEKLRNGGH